MYLPLDMPPMTNYQVQELIVDYNTSLDFVDNMTETQKWSYWMGTENYLNLNDNQFEYLETVYYPIFEEEEQQRKEEEERQAREQWEREIAEYAEAARNNNSFIDENTPPEDICHLGGGVVVKCSEFFDY